MSGFQRGVEDRLTTDTFVSTPVIVYSPDHRLDAIAVKHGQHYRELLKTGIGSTDSDAYVKYAQGDESVGSMYGFRPWRLEKLRRLKKMHDPEQ